MFRARLAFAFALALGLCPALRSSLIADEPEPRSVAVTGTAVTRAVPDTIVWNIRTTDNDPDLRAAKQASDATAKQILTLRDVLGLKAQDIQSGRLSIQKVYHRDRQGNQLDFRHFSLTRSFTVR